MTEKFGALMNSTISLKRKQDDLGRASILRIPSYTLGGDRIGIIVKVYDLTPEL